MIVHRILIQQTDDGWLAVHALEDESVHTQGRSLDEVLVNVREVAELLYGDLEVQVELVVPSSVRIA